MCFPLLSSRIQAERKANADKFTQEELLNINFDGGWPEKSLFQNFLEKASPHIRILETKGGEPFLVKNLTKTIQSVENKQNAIFAFTTNGSVDMPPEFFDEISKFEKIWGSVGIDGVGVEGEYVRHGSDWVTVEKNIHKLSQLKNCTFRLSVVLQFFSSLTFPKIFEFAKKHNYDIELLNCTQPDYLSINSILPQHMQQFQNWARITAAENPTVGYLASLNGFLDQYKFDADLHQNCRRYLDAIDGIRNNRLDSIQNLF
jgi:MoaA/NifB/PqqE/SkfB family radical SAM enzyme